jgi:CHASE3 domain sensor protein
MIAVTASNDDVVMRRLTRRGSAAVFVSACAIAGAGAVLYGIVADLVEGGRGIGLAHETLAALQDASSRVRDAEHAEQSYLLTGEPRYLAAYHAAAARVPEDLAALRRLTADDPDQKARLDRLEAAVGRRLEIAAGLVESYRRSGLSAVRGRLRAPQGKEAADEVAAVAREVQAELRRHLEQRHRANESLARTAVGVGGACLAGCVGGFACAFVLLGREISLRRRVEVSLQETNHCLAGSVRELEERTADADALAALGDYLQSCRSQHEGYAILARALPGLLPGVAGAVGIVDRSRGAVEMVASWGDGAEPFAAHFGLDECWGLRQGRPHHTADGWDPVCGHLGPHRWSSRGRCWGCCRWGRGVRAVSPNGSGGRRRPSPSRPRCRSRTSGSRRRSATGLGGTRSRGCSTGFVSTRRSPASSRGRGVKGGRSRWS